MAKYRSRSGVRRELSDEAKLARLRQWEKEFKLNSDDINKLIEKYGPYAYDVVRLARAEPANVAKRINQPFRNSNNTIHYFAENEMTTATLAKAINKNEMKVEAGLAQYNISAKQTLENAEIKSVQMTADKQQKKFEEKVDEHAATKEEPVRDNKPEATITPEETITDDLTPEETMGVDDMTLDDYLKYYKPEDKPLTGKALEEAAFKDFGKGEGVSTRVYVEKQNSGHPTIGNGCLIIHKDLCKEPPSKEAVKKHGTVQGWKNIFRNQNITDANGTPLTSAQKDKIFEDLRAAVRNGTLRTKNIGGYNVVISPASAANIRMPQAEIRKTFNTRFAANLKKVQTALGNGDAKKGAEIFNKYPKNLQLSLVHTYYAGKPGNRITDAIQRGRIDPQNPQSVVDELRRIRSSKSEGNRNQMNRASEAEARTRRAANDTIQDAQRRYAEMQAKLQQQKRQQNLDNNIRIVMSMNQQNTPS